MIKEDNRNMRPVLLSRSELQWLLGNTRVSKTFEYKMLSNIRRKIQALTAIELPLLIKHNLVSYQLDGKPGRDLEPIIAPAILTKSTQALVRQSGKVTLNTNKFIFYSKSKNN
jgi:hypothetical protein